MVPYYAFPVAIVTKSWTKCGPSCIFPLSHTKDPKVSDTHCKTLCRRPEWENSEANMLLCRKRGKKGVLPSFVLHEHLTTKWKVWTQRNTKTILPERSTNWAFGMLIPTTDIIFHTQPKYSRFQSQSSFKFWSSSVRWGGKKLLAPDFSHIMQIKPIRNGKSDQ